MEMPINVVVVVVVETDIIAFWFPSGQTFPGCPSA